MYIKKGDIVQVISGDSKGATGKVLKVFVKEQTVLIEGVNKISRHTKPCNDYPEGGIIQKEAAVRMSNVMYYEMDGNAGHVTRIGYRKNSAGKKVRYSKKTRKDLDK